MPCWAKKSLRDEDVRYFRNPQTAQSEGYRLYMNQAGTTKLQAIEAPDSLWQLLAERSARVPGGQPTHKTRQREGGSSCRKRPCEILEVRPPKRCRQSDCECCMAACLQSEGVNPSHAEGLQGEQALLQQQIDSKDDIIESLRLKLDARVDLVFNSTHLQVDAEAPKELVSRCHDVAVGLEKHQFNPKLSPDGTGGTYFLAGLRGRTVALKKSLLVFKPKDEEPGLHREPQRGAHAGVLPPG